MSQQTIIVQANADYPVTVAAKYLSIVSSTGACSVEMDNDGFSAGLSGSQFSKAEGFKRLVFRDTSGAVNTITFEAGNAPSPSRVGVVQSVGATFIGPNSGTFSFPVSTVSPLFPGVDSQGRSRKIVYISNPDGTNTINVSNLVQIVGTIQPKAQMVPIETSADLKFIGTNGSQYTVCEIFYSNPTQ